MMLLPQASLITAGGQARRFGSDKVLATLEGQTLLERVAASLPYAPTRLIVSGNPRHSLSHWHTVPDLRPGLGPLAGLETGLSLAPVGWVCFCAADMPYLNAAYWNVLLGYTSPTVQAVIGQDASGRPQPLAALYHVSVLPVVKQLLDAQTYRMTALTEHIRMQNVPFEALNGVAPLAYHNVNTPQDL